MELTFKRTRKVDDIMEIVESLGDFFDEDAFDELEEEIEEDETFAAFDETGKMQGFIIFCELNPQVIEITWMAVRKDCQGQGIGKRLINFGLSILNKKQKYQICMAKTIGEGDRQRSFKATREFYIRGGFVPLESVKPYPGWHKDKYVQTFVKCLGH